MVMWTCEQDPGRSLSTSAGMYESLPCNATFQFSSSSLVQMDGRSCDAVLVLVCGLPAAGKTTLAKHLVSNRSTDLRLFERISFDDIYEQRATEAAIAFHPETWKACQQEMVMRVRMRLENPSTCDGTTQQLVLLVDDNFQYRSLRKRFFHLAGELNCGFGLLYANVASAVCRERNAARNENAGRVPDDVFQRMMSTFEAPDGQQNGWEVNKCKFNGTEDWTSIDEKMDVLIGRAERELRERRSQQLDRQKVEAQQHFDRFTTQQNVLHLVDIQLRQWISRQLRDDSELPPGMTKAQLASQLNHRRKTYIASIKQSHSNIAGSAQGEAIDQVVVSLVQQFQQQ